jgi:hypothetical protein
MNLQEMISAINRRIDDVIATSDAVDWLNEGQNLMGIAVGAKFPQLSVSDMTGTFAFDEVYHGIPILFACARYKEQDSSLQESNNFINQFEAHKKDFVERYELPPRYRMDRQSQQFTATDGQDTFTITKIDYSPTSGELKVYVNDLPVSLISINDDKSFVLALPCLLGDAVTAVWEEHPYLEEPPYPWMKNW